MYHYGDPCGGGGAGIDSGMTLSAGEVAAASKEHPGAELFVEVLVQPHPLFERAGSDVVLPHHLDMVDAALGTEITCGVLIAGTVAVFT
jgi:molecular chaperone DnaJ